jgi:hypothetical protein
MKGIKISVLTYLNSVYWILFAGLLFLVYNLGLIPAEKLRIIIIIVFAILLCLEFIFEIVKNIKGKSYTSNKTIALLQGIKIVALISALYSGFKVNAQIGFEAMMNIKYNVLITTSVVVVLNVLLYFLNKFKV